MVMMDHHVIIQYFVLCFMLLAYDAVRPNQIADRGQKDCWGKIFGPFSPVGHVGPVRAISQVSNTDKKHGSSPHNALVGSGGP
jgi:hypothetical protein